MSPRPFPAPGRASALLGRARATTGFMPDDEGQALARAALLAASSPGLPPVLVEIGAYCGRSTLYLAAGVASARGEGGQAIIFSVDHHHGSEENQLGWPYHDPSLVDPATGLFDTLAPWRAAVDGAGAADLVVGVVGDSPTVASFWTTPLGLLFIDGGHGSEPAWADYRGWTRHVACGGLVAIHDVFPDPKDGGRPPYEVYLHALSSGAFAEERDLGLGSLRVLRRLGSCR